ncbi:MAG: sensor histidine kinase, partial [Chthoniobacterales bacterium]
LTTSNEPLPVADASPFLENFLIDAEECWAAGGATRAVSGPWIEQASDGSEASLEATALTLAGQPALLLEKLGEVFEKKKAILQHARETVIAYQRLNSETQKKEILLSCIAEEMNAALANAITALRLIELEKHSARAQQLLGLALRATEEQQALINKVLNVFAAELEGLYGRAGDRAAAAGLGEVLAAADAVLAAPFTEKRVTLELPADSADLPWVAMDADHLERVLTSLLENALQNAPAGGTVALVVKAEGDTVVLRVRDNGPPLPASVDTDIFSKETLSNAEASGRQMRLQFCRIAVEKCHGELGFEVEADEGNCFWVQLPRAASATAAAA